MGRLRSSILTASSDGGATVLASSLIEETPAVSEGAARRARDQTMKGAASERPRCKRTAGGRRDGSGRGKLGGSVV